jgi:hypothetical protein
MIFNFVSEKKKYFITYLNCISFQSKCQEEEFIDDKHMDFLEKETR